MSVARLFAIHVDRGLTSSPEAPETSHFLYAQHPLTRVEVSGTVTAVRGLSGGERLCFVVDDGTGCTQAVMYTTNQDGSASHHRPPTVGEMVSVAGRLGWGFRSGSAGGGRCREISVVSSVRLLGSLDELAAVWIEVARLHLEEYSRPISSWLAGIPAAEASRWDVPLVLRQPMPEGASFLTAGGGHAPAGRGAGTRDTGAPALEEALPPPQQQQQEQLLAAMLEGLIQQLVAELYGVPAAMMPATPGPEDWEEAEAAPPPPIPLPPPPAAAQSTMGSMHLEADVGAGGVASVAPSNLQAEPAATEDEGREGGREFTLAELVDVARHRLAPGALAPLLLPPQGGHEAAASSLVSREHHNLGADTDPDWLRPFSRRVARVLRGLVERGFVYERVSLPLTAETRQGAACHSYGPVTSIFLENRVLSALRELATAATTGGASAAPPLGRAVPRGGFVPSARGWTAKDVTAALAAQVGVELHVPALLVRDTLTRLASSDEAVFCLARDRYMFELPAAGGVVAGAS